MKHDRQILVFGASGLIGKNIVTDLLKKNCMVVAIDKQTESIENLKNEIDYSSRLEICNFDVTKRDELASFISEYKNSSGIVNALYLKNNSYGSDFLEVTPTDFNENINLNLTTSFSILQLAAKNFLKYKKEISLVFFSSIYGSIAPKFEIYKDTSMTMPVEYACIKSSLNHLCRYVAKYVKDSRFRVNTISPGGIYDSQPKKFLSNYQKKTHGTGMLSSSRIAKLALFLLSEDSNYITGQDIIIDDGFTL